MAKIENVTYQDKRQNNAAFCHTLAVACEALVLSGD